MRGTGNKDRNIAFDSPSAMVAQMMTPGVIQIPGDVLVSEAALVMQREQVPCLLVKDTETLIGIVTHSDIVKKVVAQGLEPHNIEARAIMSRPVHSIEFDRPIEEATTLMVSTGVPLLIVTHRNQPVGILTARDLVSPPQRRHAQIPASVRISDGRERGVDQKVTIIQLSHTGAFVETPNLLLPGTHVTLSFTLPGSTVSIHVHGVIVTSYHPPHRSEGEHHRRTPGVEIQFTDLSDEDQSRISAWAIQNLYKKSS
ncbi:MAG TPA: CBS domain-containing protein [Nitrospiraceae bacterium]|jgi:CBS domain-containing protein|nr:CBS domain-containing protein [Nitrospiraceae bacterium]